MSALSMEEKRVMESLDRINEKLKSEYSTDSYDQFLMSRLNVLSYGFIFGILISKMMPARMNCVSKNNVKSL